MVRLLYIIDFIILIYNLDILKNGILFVLLGLGLKAVYLINLNLLW